MVDVRGMRYKRGNVKIGDFKNVILIVWRQEETRRMSNSLDVRYL